MKGLGLCVMTDNIMRFIRTLLYCTCMAEDLYPYWKNNLALGLFFELSDGFNIHLDDMTWHGMQEVQDATI